MNRKEFGELVAALRKEHTDFIEDSDGEFRLRQWSQEKLAEMARLPVGTIQAVEQGKLVKIEPKILIDLADALGLTTMERKEFALASTGVPSHAYTRAANEFDLHGFLRTVWHIRLPSFMSDNFGDFVAANHCIIRFLDITAEFVEKSLREYPGNPAAQNYMSVICSPDSGYRATLGHGWTDNVLRNMLFFRRITFRYRSQPHFNRLWRALMKNKEFKRFWNEASLRDSEEPNDSDLELYAYHHTRFDADVKYLAAVSQIITGDGERYLTTYIPADGKTAVLFEQSAQEGGEGWMTFR